MDAGLASVESSVTNVIVVGTLRATPIDPNNDPLVPSSSVKDGSNVKAGTSTSLTNNDTAASNPPGVVSPADTLTVWVPSSTPSLTPETVAFAIVEPAAMVTVVGDTVASVASSTANVNVVS